MSHWSHVTGAFGLPDDYEETEDVVRAAIGPVLRTATAEVLSQPLPADLKMLLARLRSGESRRGHRGASVAQAKLSCGKLSASQRRRSAQRGEFVAGPTTLAAKDQKPGLHGAELPGTAA
jgi:hypothetical protein